MNRCRLVWFGILTAGAAPGCSGEDLFQARAPVLPELPARPTVSAAISPNPNNVLSSVVTFTTQHAESARVVYVAHEGTVDSTPYVRVSGEADTIVTLGLRASTGYRNVVEVAGQGGAVTSDTLSFTTDPLPDLLQRLTISPRGVGGPGLTLTSLQVGGIAIFALAFDSAGTIRWYRRFEGTEKSGGELKQQTNGHFTLYRGGSTGVEPVPGHYIEFTPAGDSLRAIAVPPPRYLDNHEFWITTGADGGERFHFFTYERRPSDLRSIGGAGVVSLTGHQLVRLRPDGTTEFEWNAWDCVAFEDWLEGPMPGPADSTARDFDHPNSLAFDRDGDYIVSFRRLAQVMKIDAETGDIVWRLGGVRNEFTFLNDPLIGFSAQHSARVLANGNLLLYDNGNRHQPSESRAVEYALDTTTMTAALVWEFRHVPAIHTPGLGMVQRLQSGNTLIGYGQIGGTTEVASDGAVRWEAELSVDGKPAVVYRLVRIASLYRYREP
jgi:hypothetical protein